MKYLTCLHCQTRFIVKQEVGTLYLAPVNITIETKQEEKSWEVCEIVWEEKTGFFDSKFSFWAEATGPNGIYSAGNVWTVSLGRYSHPTSDDNSHRRSHMSLVLLLTKTGWEPTGRGTQWYNSKFRRPVINDTAIQSQINKLQEKFGELCVLMCDPDKGDPLWNMGRSLENIGLKEKDGFLQSLSSNTWNEYLCLTSLFDLSLPDFQKIEKEEKWAPSNKLIVELIKVKSEIEELSSSTTERRAL